MDTSLLTMMGETVVWRPLIDIDVRLNRTFGTSVPIRCITQRSVHKVTTANGDEVVAVGAIYCGGVYDVQPSDEVTWPNGRKPDIVHVDQFNDNLGGYATVIHTG